jgi:hypothetical protein
MGAAQDQRLMRLGTLSLDFPSTWEFKGSGQRAEGHGTEGEFVIVNYRVLLPGAPPEVVAQHRKVVRGFAQEKMPEIASDKHNDVLRPVSESALPGDRVLFFSVSRNSRFGRDYYFLQYLLGSSRLMAYFTVEGYGDASQAAARFESILATQRWDE